MIFLGPFCLVMEFVTGGNLEDLLGTSFMAVQEETNLYTNQLSEFSERQLLQFAVDTACGMKHLENYQVGRRHVYKQLKKLFKNYLRFIFESYSRSLSFV